MRYNNARKRFDDCRILLLEIGWTLCRRAILFYKTRKIDNEKFDLIFCHNIEDVDKKIEIFFFSLVQFNVFGPRHLLQPRSSEQQRY